MTVSVSSIDWLDVISPIGSSWWVPFITEHCSHWRLSVWQPSMPPVMTKKWSSSSWNQQFIILTALSSLLVLEAVTLTAFSFSLIPGLDTTGLDTTGFDISLKILFAWLPKLCNSWFSLYRILKKTFLKSTCITDHFTCPGLPCNGILSPRW